MKKLCFMLLLHAAALGSYAQNKKLHTLPAIAASPVADQLQQDAFTIVLRPAIRSTFLYAIYREGTLVHNQTRHPQTQGAVGFPDRQAAYAAAGKMIGSYQRTGVFPAMLPAQPANKVHNKQLQ